MTACPKFTYIRSRKLLEAVASLPCMNCGLDGCTQAAHSNQSQHGKGKGIKASDVFVAALCRTCHQLIDQGSRLCQAERLAIWTAAWRATVRELVRRGLWPNDIPIPDIRSFH